MSRNARDRKNNKCTSRSKNYTENNNYGKNNENNKSRERQCKYNNKSLKESRERAFTNV